MKPRIVWDCGHWMAFTKHQRSTGGFFAVGFGATPLEAFRDWEAISKFRGFW